jgi:hypothetical protein
MGPAVPCVWTDFGVWLRDRASGAPLARPELCDQLRYPRSRTAQQLELKLIDTSRNVWWYRREQLELTDEWQRSAAQCRVEFA